MDGVEMKPTPGWWRERQVAAELGEARRALRIGLGAWWRLCARYRAYWCIAGSGEEQDSH